MTPDDYFSAPFWLDRFHWCAFRAYILAACEGKETDSEYVKKLAYRLFESKN